MRPSVSADDVLEWVSSQVGTYEGDVYGPELCKQIAWILNDPAVMKQFRAQMQARARKREQHGAS